MKSQRQLFGPESAKVPTRRKTVLWAKVVAAVNSGGGGVKRMEDTCRKRYYDIKRRVKMAREAKSARKTGGGQPYIARYLEYEEPMRSVIPPEVVSATHVRDSDKPRKNVFEKSSATRPPVTPSTSDDDDDDDAAEAGPSKEVWSSRSGTSVRHHHKKPVAAKKARSDVQGQPQQATPPRRLSTVCSVPPLQILDTPPRRHPQSPHLDSSSPGNSIPPQQQQHSDMEETIILEMQPLSQGISPPAPGTLEFKTKGTSQSFPNGRESAENSGKLHSQAMTQGHNQEKCGT
ncbi:uncharacterized protein LOC134909784 isoform X2 [Pseudophryne corroboree]|uniref:uncharacterized protein LOC134909784 isoform X2 n=1 Tax=Pseudophryne corroboree TaxID=495146 RepID=UPI003081C1AC